MTKTVCYKSWWLLAATSAKQPWFVGYCQRQKPEPEKREGRRGGWGLGKMVEASFEGDMKDPTNRATTTAITLREMAQVITSTPYGVLRVDY